MKAARTLAAVLLALLPLQLFAVSGTPVYDSRLTANGFVRVTGLGSAVTLGSVPANSVIVMIQAETQNVRWRDDGTNPTAAIGMLLEAGDTLVYNGDLAAIKFIEVTASASLNVSFYK